MLKYYAILIILIVQASVALGQNMRITEDFRNQKLSNVFKKLERKYKLHISYNAKLVRNVRVSKKLNGIPLKEALKTLLKETNLDYVLTGDKYVAVFPGKPKNPVKTEQVRTYQGIVLDKATNEEVPFAKIRISGTNKGVYADEHGKFLLKTSEKDFTLEVSTVGYQRRIISSKDLKTGAFNKLNMTVDYKEFKEVVVEYLAEGMTVSKDVSAIDIRPKRFGATPGTTDPDVFRTVQNVPGINSANETVSEMQIRGGTSDQNLILWEGITLYHSGHFNGMLSSVNPNVIDNATVHRGIYDPYYGGRASGLIELSTMKKLPRKFESGVGVNMLAVDGYIKAPIGKRLGVLISARRSYTDILPTSTYRRYAERIYQQSEILQQEVTFQVNEDSAYVAQQIDNYFRFLDVNGKLLYELGDSSSISLSFLRTDNRLDHYSVNRVDEDSTNNHNLFSTRNTGLNMAWNQRWSKNWSSYADLTYSDYNYDFVERFEWQEDDERYSWRVAKFNSLENLGWKARVTADFGEHAVNFGYQGDLYRLRFGYEEFSDSVSVYSETGAVNSALSTLHANYRWKYDKWLVKAGGRLVYASNLKQVFAEPRIYAQYNLNKVFTFKAGMGIQHQFVSQTEDLDQAQNGVSNRIWVFANENEVPVMQSQSLNAGLVARWKGWHFEFEGYLKDIYGISNFADNKSMSSGFDRGNAYVKGIDVLVKKRWKGLRTWLTYTLSDVDYSFPQLGEESFPAPFNQPHVLKWVNTYTWKNFDFSLSWKLASGKPYTKAQGLDTMGVFDPEDPYDHYFIEYESFNNSRLPFYHRMDLTILYNLKPKKEAARWKVQFGLSLLNLYNQKNYLSRTYRLDTFEDDEGDTQARIVTVDRFFLRRTPNFLIRFTIE